MSLIIFDSHTSVPQTIPYIQHFSSFFFTLHNNIFFFCDAVCIRALTASYLLCSDIELQTTSDWCVMQDVSCVLKFNGDEKTDDVCAFNEF